MNHRRPRLAIAAQITLLLLACHSSTPAMRAYLLESSTGADLLKGTTVHLRFGDGQISLQADCNSMAGAYTLEGDRVVVSALMQTEMGCDAEGTAHDAFLGRFFRSKPRFSAKAERLTFASGSARLIFVDRELADPDRPLRGTVWEIDQYVDGETAMGLLGIEAPRLTFVTDGTVYGTRRLGATAASSEP